MGHRSAIEIEDQSLLKPESKYINPHAFEAGSRWHCHSGWFAPATDRHGEVLNQLNLTGLKPDAGDLSPLVTIEHIQSLKAKPGQELKDYRSTEGGGSLDDLMQRLHDANKSVLSDLLQPAVSKSINLSKKPTRA